MPNKLLMTGMALMLAIGIPALAQARGGGGGGGGGIGAGPSGGGFGGNSSAHISTPGQTNTNGPNATDRDFGRNRAEDRANPQGLSNSNASKTLNDNERATTSDLNRAVLNPPRIDVK